MIQGLSEEIQKFSIKIKNDFPDYLSLYEYFCEYINLNYSNENLKEFLIHNLCRRDIINSCVYYLEKSNATSTSAIDKYLNAITKLYNTYLSVQGYSSTGLDAIIPLSSCKFEVKDKVKEKELREKIKYIQVKDFDKDDNVLSFIIDDNKRLDLTLPGYLSKEIADYLSELPKNDTDYLFVNKNGHVLESSFFSHTFALMKKQFDLSVDSFTLTGMAKYAIKNMIREGMSSAQIKITTGMEDDIINDCQRVIQFEEMNDMSVLIRNINKRIRAIATYDDMNFV